MALPFYPAYVEGGGTVAVRHYPIKSGETFVQGSPATINAGEVDEIDTNDVALVVGVAAAADASAYGYGASDHPDSRFVTGRSNTLPVYVANRSTVFQGQISNNGTMVAPALSDVGVSYGIIKMSGGEWTVDRADTTNNVVTVVGIVPQGEQAADPFGKVFFKFIASTLNP